MKYCYHIQIGQNSELEKLKPLLNKYKAVFLSINFETSIMDNLPFWLLTVAYSGHILEEYVLDWRTWVQETSKLTLEWTEFFVANFAVIILGISCSMVGFEYPIFSYMFIGLAAVNGLFAHIGTTIVKRKFSPGLITSITLFIPICT